MPSPTTPASVLVQPRTPEFDFEHAPRIWLKDEVASHFFNALSLYVPASEKLVIQVLREVKPLIKSEQLHIQVQAVIRQEGQHAKLHRETNRWLLKRYPKLRWAVWLQEKAYQFIAKVLPAASIPAAFEHFTSALAKDYLKDTSQWAGENKNALVSFLTWHAIEELEHQAVCLDVYREVQPESKWLIPFSLALLWLPLTLMMLYGTQAYLLFQDGQLKKRSVRQRFWQTIKHSAPVLWTGIWRYRHKALRVWDAETLKLYEQSINTWDA